MIVLVGARRSPCVVRRVVRHADQALHGEAPCHRLAHLRNASREDGIDVRLDGIHVGRNEDARSVRALLMDVVHDLWMPLAVQRIDDHLRLDLRERIPVAVVVVAGVIVVQRRRLAALPRRAE